MIKQRKIETKKQIYLRVSMKIIEFCFDNDFSPEAVIGALPVVKKQMEDLK